MAFHLPAQGGSSGSLDSYEELADINIIPLVDVMLVLLIIFMVTAPLSIGGIAITLPKTHAPQAKMEEDRLILTVNGKGQYFIEKNEILRANLKAKLRAVYANREKKDIFIRADEGVRYSHVVYAMGAAKEAGAVKLNLLTDPSRGKTGS